MRPSGLGLRPRGEAPEYTGLDVIIVRDGKIAALYVFLDFHPFIAATALSMIARLIATRAPSARYPEFPRRGFRSDPRRYPPEVQSPSKEPYQ